jgi:hypothetical protein
VIGMSGPLGIALAGLVMLVGVSSAYAASGRVVFSGGVIEPTCLTEDVDGDMASPPVAGLAPRRLTCGRTPTEPGRSYSRTVIRLDAASVANNRLLDYFVGYANPADARLVVRTYE